jgi:hypothetical protein
MTNNRNGPVDVLLVTAPESAGSALYGMLDVLCWYYLTDTCVNVYAAKGY